MTNPQRDGNANARLTQLLRQKCGEQRLRVMRIRWGAEYTVEVDVQLDLPGSSAFQPLGTFLVLLDPRLGLAPPMSCLENQVVDAVGEAFACDEMLRRLRQVE